MCGRYALHSHPDVVALQFNLASAPEIEARYNICPSNEILIVREHAQRGRVCDQSRWGLVPSWAKDASIGNRLANVQGRLQAVALPGAGKRLLRMEDDAVGKTALLHSARGRRAVRAGRHHRALARAAAH